MIERQLAQARENGTSAVSVLANGTDEVLAVATVILCNQTGSNVTYRLFHDDDGTTYDETTALAWDVQLGPYQTDILCLKAVLGGNQAVGNFAYRTSTGDAITITLYGFTV